MKNKKKIIIAIIGIFFVITIIILTLEYFIPKTKLETLSKLNQYAALYPEFQKNDIKNWHNPKYKCFYKKVFHLSRLQKLLTTLGLKSHVQWNIEAFSTLLDRTTKNLIKTKETHNIIPFTQGTKFVIWGNLNGAFHSIVRDLSLLKKLQIINENLKIIKEKSYFVFLGDAISKSPYSLETLNTILLLMHKNKNKVFYIKGEHETDSYWENFDMRRALLFREGKSRLQAYKKSNISNKINTLFENLPTFLQLKKANEKNIICTHNQNVPKIPKKNTNLLFVGGTKNLEDYLEKSNGLKFLGYVGPAAKWSILSSPTQIHQKFLTFHYDAFVILTAGPSVEKSILALYNQDTRKKEGFKETYFNPIFGYTLPNKKRENFKKKSIVNIGSTMALTGASGPLGNENKSGLESKIISFNNYKNKVLLKPTIFNDGYVPRIALKNVEKLKNMFDIDTIVIPTGTPTLNFYLSLVQSGKTSVLFPATGADKFRNPSIKHIVNFRGTYTQEVQAVLKYLIKTQGIKSFAFFYQNDSYGRPIAEAAQAVLKKNGINKWLDIPHIRTQTNFSTSIKKMRAFSPSVIGCFSSFAPTQLFFSQLGNEYMANRMIFGVSFLYSEAFQHFLKKRGIPFILSSVVPDPSKSSLPIAREYLKTCKKQKLVPNLNSFEGYIAGSLLVEAITHLKSPLTSKKIIGYFENLKNYNLKGLTLTFNPKKRDLSQPIWFRTLEGKWLESKESSTN